MKPTPSSRWRVVALLAALILVLAACGDDDDTAAEDEETTTTEAEGTSTSETSAPAASTSETSAPAASTSETSAPAEGISIELGEWFVEVGEEVSAGTVTFAVENTGENPHAFAIAVGDSYEDLPQLENGAVDTDTLGDLFLGATDNVEPGASTTIEFDLEAGNYVFFCPIQFGPNSHAGRGQVLSVTVG